jgi:hypothetical protein
MGIFYWAIDSIKRWLSRISELNHSRTTQITDIGQKLDTFLPKSLLFSFYSFSKELATGGFKPHYTIANWELSKYIILRNIRLLKIY